MAEAKPSTVAAESPSSPYFKGIRIRAALLLGPLPLVVTFFVQLWQQRPHYQFIPIYVAALAGLCWKYRPTELQEGGRPSVWQLGFLTAGFTVFVPAALLFSPWLGMIAWLLLLPAATLVLLPRPTRQMLLPVWLISWFVVPPPFEWDTDLLQWLRAQTSQATGVVLDVMGVIHLQAGNTFEVPGHQFFIEDACSGIHSLLSILGLALLWAVYLRLPVLASICSVASAASAAIALNIVRVLAVVLACTRWNLDLSKGWRHELLGVVLFGVALLFLGSAQQFWLFWFSPLDVNLPWQTVDPELTETPLPESAPPHRAAPSIGWANSAATWSSPGKTSTNWLVWWPTLPATAALLLWVPQLYHGARMLAAAPILQALLDPRQVAMAVDQPALPMELHGWKQVDYKPVVRDRHHLEGEFSRQWTYQAPWGLVHVSFDFPFSGPHPLLRCYQSTGWTPSVQQTALAAQIPGGFQQVALKRREFEVGSLIYGLWDDQGTLVTPRAAADGQAVPQPFLVRLWNRLTPAASSPAIAPSNTYQFQVLVTGEFPLGEAEQVELLQFFLDARDRLRQKFRTDAPATENLPTSTDS